MWLTALSDLAVLPFMDLATIKELAGFLFDIKPDVRLVAASHLVRTEGQKNHTHTR